ncbi:MAG: response regulator [Rickettsia endosymbiont of Labidopullus appendiculatus]|nr:response regulator [Rickettsia endosymbiont of Labidopullus appendiculatus]
MPKEYNIPELFTILFVDDEPICHDAINLVLRHEQKYKIINAYTGQEAVDLSKIYANNIDIIFLDISLPDMTGCKVHKQIRSDKNLARIPIIFQSGLSSNHQEIKGLLQGQATYIIRKPYKNEELLKIIRQFHNACMDLPDNARKNNI